jgi:hypothetical protein
MLIAAAVLCTLAAPAQDALGRKVQAIYEQGAYQRDLPVETVAPRSHGRDAGPLEPRVRESEEASQLPEWLRRLLEIVLPILPWLAIGALLIVLLVAFLRARGSLVPARRPDEAAPKERPAVPSAPVSPDEPVADAAALARDGRFAEAIHALLLAAIAKLRGTNALAIGRSSTSREIAASAALPSESRDALHNLVRAVELTLFGGRPAGEADYLACAADFARIGAAP